MCFISLQAVQQESSGSDLVLCEVHLLWSVCLSDQMWLPQPHPGKLPHQKLQLPKPVPLSGVWEQRQYLNINLFSFMPSFYLRQYGINYKHVVILLLFLSVF